MTRLPTPGADSGSWGNILNEFLSKSLASDGNLKAGIVEPSHIQDEAVTGDKIKAGTIDNSKLLDGTIASTKLSAAAQASLAKADGALQAANNLSDVTSATARTNLGLGSSATMNVGTTAGTVAAGDDGRVTGAVQRTGETGSVDLSGATVTLPSQITAQLDRADASAWRTAAVSVPRIDLSPWSSETTTDTPSVAYADDASLITGMTAVGLDNPSITCRGLVPARFTVTGNTYVINVSNGFEGGQAVPTGFATSASYDIEFDFYGTSFAIRLTQYNTAAHNYWLYVDGRPTTAAPVTFTTAGGSARCTTKFTWGSAAQRRIRLRMPEYIGVFKLYFNPTDTASPVHLPTPKLAILGDSWIGGTTDHTDHTGVISRIRELTGWEIFKAGQGGTGYVNPGPINQHKNAYGGIPRMNAIQAANPDYLWVVNGGNDDTYTVQQVSDAATALYADAASRCPNMKLIVIGPQQVSTPVTATRSDRATAIKTAAEAAPNALGYIDQITTPWITGTGTSTSPVGDGNADVFSSGVNAGHLTQAGVDWWSRRILSEAIKIMRTA